MTANLVLNVTATQRPIAVATKDDEFAVLEYNTFNYLPGLIDDQTFNKYRQKSVRQDQPLIKKVRRTILAKHAIFVRMHNNPISHDRVLVSMEIENNRETNAVIHVHDLFLTIAASNTAEMKSSKSQADIDEYFKIQPEQMTYPIVLNPMDELCALFTVSLAVDNIPYEFFAERDKYRIVLNVAWTPSLYSTETSIVSSFFRTLDIQKLFQEKKEEDIAVSFTVSSDVSVRKIFTVHIFVVNRSPEVKDISILVPHEDREISSRIRAAVPSRTSGANELSILMPPSEFLQHFSENERHEASLVCLESNVELGVLQPNTCKSAILHFVPVKEGLHYIRWIQLMDNETGSIMDLRDVLKIYVKPFLSESDSISTRKNTISGNAAR